MDLSSDVGSKSPASSPSASVFSYDAASSQSSTTSVSSSSAEAIWESDDVASTVSNTSRLATSGARAEVARFEACGGTHALQLNSVDDTFSGDTLVLSPKSKPNEAIPVSARQHPRRTRPQSRICSQDGCLEISNSRPPPSLVRQDVRKDNFVDGLVGEQS